MSDLDKLKFIIGAGYRGKELPGGTMSFATPYGTLLIHKDVAAEIGNAVLREGYTLDKPDGYVQSVRAIGDYVLYKPVEPPQPTQNKYHRNISATISGASPIGTTITVDVYDVLKAFDVTDPALQHLIKKALCCGLRGHKDRAQDLQDILDSAQRAKELHTDVPN